MRLLRVVALLCCLVLACALPSARAADETGEVAGGSGRPVLVIPGTGDSQAMLRAVAERFNAEQTAMEVVIPDSVGSSGGITALLADHAVLARVARELKPRERQAGLTWRLFARSPVVIVANLPKRPSGAPPYSLSSQQFVAIYEGRIRDLSAVGGPPGKMYPLMRERGDSSRSVLNRLLPGFADINKPVGKVYYTTPETVDAIATHPGALGFVPLAAVQGRGLTVFALDGVEPTPDNVRSGAYPLAAPQAMVYKGDPGPAARTFMEYLEGPEAAGIITRFGGIPSGGR